MSDQLDSKSIIKLTEEEYSRIDEIKKLYKKISLLSQPDESDSKNYSGSKTDVDQKAVIKDGL